VRVETLAERLSRRVDSDWTAVALMDGAFMFAADLMRALSRRGIDPAFDTMRVSSYGDETRSGGVVRALSHLGRPVAGRGCLLLDDICETGNTLAFARRMLLRAGAAEVTTAVFALKRVPRPAIVPDLHAWDAPDAFVVGYGMDHAGRWRGLPYVGVVE